MAFLKSLSWFRPKSAPAVELAAFGKHPGWDDHTDDMGLDTEPLVNAKRLLYVQGINQNIDAGAWESLDPSPGAGVIEDRLDLFRHDFLWRMPPNVMLAGRLWSSSDGKGRDKYPMVVCAQLTDLPLEFARQVVLPALPVLQERCSATASAAAVREIVDAQRLELRSRIAQVASPEPLSPREVAAVANHADMRGAGGRVGFQRIVYQLASMKEYRVPAKSGAARAEQLRLPACGMKSADALLFWMRFTWTLLDESAALLLFAPDQGDRAPWVDLIVGEPAPANFFCIKAGTKKVPLTSDIPYTLDGSFTRAVDQFVESCAAMPADAALPAWPL